MKKKVSRHKHALVWGVLTALYVVFIFSNSMKPAVSSSLDSGAALRLVRDFLASGGIDGGGISEHFIRKAAHFMEYAVFGMLLIGCFRAYGLSVDKRIPYGMLLGFFVPFADETIQLFVPGRCGQLSDVWLDYAGWAVGTVFFLAVLRLGKRRGSKDKDDKKLQDDFKL